MQDIRCSFPTNDNGNLSRYYSNSISKVKFLEIKDECLAGGICNVIKKKSVWEKRLKKKKSGKYRDKMKVTHYSLDYNFSMKVYNFLCDLGNQFQIGRIDLVFYWSNELIPKMAQKKYDVQFFLKDVLQNEIEPCKIYQILTENIVNQGVTN